MHKVYKKSFCLSLLR